MNFFKKHNLNRQLTRFAKASNNRKRQFCTIEEAKSVHLFATCRSLETVYQLKAWADLLLHKGKQVMICCLTNNKSICDILQQENNLVIDSKDFNITGNLKSNIKKILTNQKYDLLIDTDIEADMESLYIKSLIDAEFRIGRTAAYSSFYDFIVLCNEQYSVGDYIKNVDIYTKKVKENS
jgi:hypothetical protein